MKKLLVLVGLVTLMVSSQSFAFIRVTTLNCGALRTGDDHMVVGVGYDIRIASGFDTHTVKPDGTFGAAMVPSFQLVTKVIAPNAQPHLELLTIVSQDANGNYNLKGEAATVIVNKDFTKALLNIDNATASCQ